MKYPFTILILLVTLFAFGQNNEPDFTWGNCSFYNLTVGEPIVFNGQTIQLLKTEKHYSTFKIGEETKEIKLTRRSLPHAVANIRIYVADNKNIRKLDDDREIHGLLTKDVLIGVSKVGNDLLDRNKYVFPINFSNGFLWNTLEDTYFFSYRKSLDDGKSKMHSYPGIGINMHDARGIQKHWLMAVENSTVVWVEDKNLDVMNKQACVLLESNSQPGIYYLYNHLYNKNLEVRKGQKLLRGEIIGSCWGDDSWGHFQMCVIKSDTVPSYENRFHNCVNFFPQLFEMYHQRAYGFSKNFSRGKLTFGGLPHTTGGVNTFAYEEFNGLGWMCGKWNIADKVEHTAKGEEGNARLKKVLFSGSNAASRNPNNYYDYEIAVKNGVYRIRARVGDVYKESWQKIDFEGVNAATYELDAGELKWTTERVVKVNDRRLTIRIYVDQKNRKVAGLSEVVFQLAY